MPRKMTIDEFETQCAKIHGNKYIYHQDYTKSKNKILITCPEHGDFVQEAASHLQGSGCPRCVGKQKKTKEEFINNACKIHGDKYDYSHVEYLKKDAKVCIICPEHGEFWQTPAAHLRGQGCPKCSIERRSAIKRRTKECFIKQARKVHGDKFDYSKVEYSNADEKVCIICPEHGEFWTRPTIHLKGCDCPKCTRRIGYTSEDFIREARTLHGDKYNYTKVDYVGSKTKVCIICAKHGEFWQSPYRHLSGSGCPKCNGGNREIKFLRSEKLEILTQQDLLSMDSFCLLDLVSEDRLPKEFAELAKFGENTEGRKKLIGKLTEQYGSEDSDDDHECNGECGGDCHCHDNPTDEKLNVESGIEELLQEVTPQQKQRQTVLGEIHSIASIIQRGDTKTYSSGDKMKHIVAKEMSKLWSAILRDEENHNTNTINEIKTKIEQQ